MGIKLWTLLPTVTNLDQDNKMLLLLGGLQLPFNDLTANSIKTFLAAADDLLLLQEHLTDVKVLSFRQRFHLGHQIKMI